MVYAKVTGRRLVVIDELIELNSGYKLDDNVVEEGRLVFLCRPRHLACENGDIVGESSDEYGGKRLLGSKFILHPSKLAIYGVLALPSSTHCMSGGGLGCACYQAQKLINFQIEL